LIDEGHANDTQALPVLFMIHEGMMDELRRRLARRAIVLELGGFRPPETPLASWFGRVNICARGETWPESDGGPMRALCQINLSEMPFRPPRLDDVEMIAIFIDEDPLPRDHDPNGQHWCLRAYRDLSSLVPLAQPPMTTGIRAFPLRARVEETDFPCWDDIASDVPEGTGDTYFDLFENVPGLKLGGWPTLIQSEISWAPWDRHPAAPEYVLQVDTTEKGHWSWGDGGVGYFGRGTTPGHENEWTLAWQCH
jgi:uncharacterized protein YwqG